MFKCPYLIRFFLQHLLKYFANIFKIRLDWRQIRPGASQQMNNHIMTINITSIFSYLWWCSLTHLSLVSHICISELGHHWVRQCFVTCYAPSHYLNQCLLIVTGSMGKQERLKCWNTLGCLDQYAAQNSKYARPPIPSQPPTQKVFFQWNTQYDPAMKHSHCETVYAKELFQ